MLEVVEFVKEHKLDELDVDNDDDNKGGESSILSDYHSMLQPPWLKKPLLKCLSTSVYPSNCNHSGLLSLLQYFGSHLHFIELHFVSSENTNPLSLIPDQNQSSNISNHSILCAQLIPTICLFLKQSLTALILSHVNLNPYFFTLLDKIASSNTIISITFSHCHLSQLSVPSNTSSPNSLLHFDISHNQLVSQDLLDLFSWLQESHLISLDISYNNTECGNLMSLSPLPKSLRRFSFVGNTLYPSGFEVLSKALSNTSVTKLDLSHQGLMTSDFFLDIAPFPSQLHTLDLSSNQIFAPAINSVFSAVSKSNIRVLNISDFIPEPRSLLRLRKLRNIKSIKLPAVSLIDFKIFLDSLLSAKLEYLYLPFFLPCDDMNIRPCCTRGNFLNPCRHFPVLKYPSIIRKLHIDFSSTPKFLIAQYLLHLGKVKIHTIVISSNSSAWVKVLQENPLVRLANKKYLRVIDVSSSSLDPQTIGFLVSYCMDNYCIHRLILHPNSSKSCFEKNVSFPFIVYKS